MKYRKTETSTSVAIPLEMKPQLENIVVKLAAEAPFVRILPLPVDDFESDVLVRRTGANAKNGKIRVLFALNARVLGRHLFVNQVRIEDVELVALDNFGRRII